MTRKKQQVIPSVSPSTQDKKESADLDWGGFIDLRLTEDDKTAYEAWCEEHQGELWAWLVDAIGSGLKLTQSFDASNDCYVASFTGQGAPTIERRFTLTARAGRLEEATYLLLYKHRICLNSDWGNYKFGSRNPQRWG